MWLSARELSNKGTKSYSCLARKAEIVVKHALFINCHWWIKAVNKKIKGNAAKHQKEKPIIAPPPTALSNRTTQNNPRAPTTLGKNNAAREVDCASHPRVTTWDCALVASPSVPTQVTDSDTWEKLACGFLGFVIHKVIFQTLVLWTTFILSLKISIPEDVGKKIISVMIKYIIRSFTTEHNTAEKKNHLTYHSGERLNSHQVKE